MFSYLQSRKFRLSAILALGAAAGAMLYAAAGQPTSRPSSRRSSATGKR